MKIRVIASFQFAGIHHWPTCDVEGKEYLRHPHRHVFHVTAARDVAHSDRDVEIIDLKEAMEKYARAMFPGGAVGSLSCEDIAIEFMRAFHLAWCRVLEDGENGAEVIA